MRDSRNMTEHASRRGTLGRRLKEGESAQSSPTLMINATAKSFLASDVWKWWELESEKKKARENQLVINEILAGENVFYQKFA